MAFPFNMMADTYSSLWKQYEEAERKDLPKTQLDILEKIIGKATEAGDYGHLLKARMNAIEKTLDISSDSLMPMLQKMEKYAAEAEGKDPTLAAVYNFIIGRMYQEYADERAYLSSLGDSAKVTGDRYIEKAFSNLDILASHKDSEYVPLVELGPDSKIFGNDLLSIMGYETERFEMMHEYYDGKNRKAAFITALEMLDKGDANYPVANLSKSKYLVSLDSLIEKYGDLTECGEAVVRRFRYMENCNVPEKEQIDYINYALGKWGSWPGMNYLRNAQKSLTQPLFRLSFSEDKVVIPGKPSIATVEVRNIKTLVVNIIPVDITADNTYGTSVNDATYKKLKPYLQLSKRKTITKRYIGQPDYLNITDSVEIPALPVGAYLIEASCDNADVEKARSLHYVTSLAVIGEGLPGNKMRYAVLDTETGQPIDGAKLKLSLYRGYYGDVDRTETIDCDNNGEVEYASKGERSQVGKVFAFTGDDHFFAPRDISYNYAYYDSDKHNQGARVSVYTDRSIYRPGQTVHAAAIVFESYPDHSAAMARKKVKFVLYNANGKEVENQETLSDNFGKCSADFTLPYAGLTGNYRVKASLVEENRHPSASTYFNVEEYKRPTFEIVFPEINEKYQNGDTVVVKAKAMTYSGVPVQNAKVTYRVKREQTYWWFFGDGDRYNNDVLYEDEVTTDDEGAFIIEMPMELPEAAVEQYKLHKRNSYFRITAYATVTDLAGESHSDELSLPLATKSQIFSCDIPQKAEKDKLKKITFTLTNLSGADINSHVMYIIDPPADKSPAEFIYQNEVVTNTPVDIASQIADLPSGEHRLYAVCGDDVVDRKFVIFNINDKKAPTDTFDWFYQSHTSFPKDGSPVTIQVGTNAPNTHILYNVFSGKKILEQGCIDTNGEIINRQFTYKEEYGSGIFITYAWVKEGKKYSHGVGLRRPEPDMDLKMKWSTFRNNLVPGQKEEWTLNITNPDDSPAEASVVAALYDKSLDMIRKHSWDFNLPSFGTLPHTKWVSGFNNYVVLSNSARLKLLKLIDMDFSHFAVPFYFPMYNDVVYSRDGRLMLGAKMMKANVAAPNGDIVEVYDAPIAMASMDAEVNDLAEPEMTTEESASLETGKEEHAQEQIRENLDETAFFYPALLSDSCGNVAIRFTLPESVTTWRFMALANSKDMKNGMLMDEAVAKKTVMVQPNMPRFLRTGDEAYISARIMNTSDKDITGKAKMELIDPETDKVVYTKQCTMAVKANNTISTAFKIDKNILKESTVYICRISASGNGFSDGEQHYLPVLPDKEMVTRTVPFTQIGAGKKNIDVDALIPSTAIGEPKLTFEYTNNPAWLAIQALPVVGTCSETNAISLVASLYANGLASHIANSSDKIETTIKQWQMDMKQKNGKESLISVLNKNQELKELVLDESPWVIDADNETDQMQRLVNLFDKNQLDYRLSFSMDNLRKLQNESGAWSWWPGMNGSNMVTTFVLTTLVRLKTMTGDTYNSSQMMNKAYSYIAKEMVKSVEEMKKYEKKGHKIEGISGMQLAYLYIFAVGDYKLDSNQQNANDYLIGKMMKMKTKQSLYDKAVSAVILACNGKKEKADEYIQSLEEYSVYKEDMGRYYDSPRATYSWFDYRIPTQVAAIEAIKRVTPEKTQQIDEMRRWLIQEKRTQSWDTPISTVNAVYAIIDGNTNVLDSGEPAKLALDGRKLDTPSAVAGLGYVKTTASGKDAKTFTADKSSDGMSWGVVYAQFQQQVTDIADSGSGLSVKREILLADNRTISDDYSKVPTLHVGDKIKVRITIKADRDYDFVSVSDRRAACMEPLTQRSGYHWGYYCAPKDNATNYYFDQMRKGTHTIETEYYIDRTGCYSTGTCNVECAYSPGFRAKSKAFEIKVE